MSITREDLRAMYLEIERQKKVSKIQEHVEKIRSIIIGSNASGHTTCFIKRPFTEDEFTQAVVDQLQEIFVDSDIQMDGPEKIKIEWTLG